MYFVVFFIVFNIYKNEKRSKNFVENCNVMIFILFLSCIFGNFCRVLNFVCCVLLWL